jgi:hypothetical protein
MEDNNNEYQPKQTRTARTDRTEPPRARREQNQRSHRHRNGRSSKWVFHRNEGLILLRLNIHHLHGLVIPLHADDPGPLVTIHQRDEPFPGKLKSAGWASACSGGRPGDAALQPSPSLDPSWRIPISRNGHPLTRPGFAARAADSENLRIPSQAPLWKTFQTRHAPREALR